MGTRYSTSLLGLCLATAAAGVHSPAAAQRWVVPRDSGWSSGPPGKLDQRDAHPYGATQGQGAVLTPEEVETIEGRFAERVRVGSQPSDPNRPHRR